MEVVSACPLPVGWIVWSSRSGSASLTVLCKATYTLRPGLSPLADEQDPLNDADQPWNDDPRRSLRAASDVAPFKQRADVLLTGHVYAPRGKPVRSLIARLVVGEVDKAIEVFVDRALTAEGQLREGPRFTRAPLLWEHAAGGPGTANPAGVVRGGPPDRYGQRAVPRLQPPGLQVTGPDDYIRPVGFGPLSPAWRERHAKLAHHAATWDHERWHERPLPDDIDPAYFNAAPADQQVDELRPDQAIVLENLHPGHARLATSLTAAIPWATVEWPGGRAEDVGFRCDTLSIDTDRGCCSLTWRAQIPLRPGEQPSQVTVQVSAAVAADEELGPPDIGSTTLSSRAGLHDAALRAALPFTAPPAPAAEADPPTQPIPTGGLPWSRSSRAVDLAGLPFVARPETAESSPLDLDAKTIDGTDDGDSFDEDATQDRWDVPPELAGALPFAAPELHARPQAWRPGGLTETPAQRPAAPWREAAPLTEASASPRPAAVFADAPSAYGRSAPLTEAAPPAPSPLTEAKPPAPPPLIGPLATPGMGATNEPSSSSAASTAPPPSSPAEAAAPPAEAAPALPLERFPIAACARIAASIARRKPETAAILAEQELASDVWAALEKHWAAAMRAESHQGKTALLTAYDEAYVARLEEERGSITTREYARLVLSVEREQAEVVLAELGLPRGALLRIQRVWLKKMAAEAGFNKSVRAAVASETEGQE
jgi:hypothetical protein